MKQPKFIAVEGLEGSGKTTVVKIIHDYLISKSIDFVATREPGGTFLGEKLRVLFTKDFPQENWLADSELLIMYAMRIQHVENLIKPNLRLGNSIISDRFHWSTMAYQGGGRRLPVSKIKKIHNIFLEKFQPDFTIYLDIDPSVGLSRIQNRFKLDRLEKENIDFFKRSRKIFLSLVEENPSSSVLIDNSSSLVHTKLCVNKVLNTLFAL